MAIVTRVDENEILSDPRKIMEFLGRYGIWYRRFEDLEHVGEDATDEEILAAFDAPIRELKAAEGYQTADVIDVKPDTPGLEAMLGKFAKEHWHSEDEVRFIVRGSGVFHIHPKGEGVFRIEVVEGDMIRVPQGTLHWFDLCEERRIRAIRLFQDSTGWTPHYTESGVDARYEAVCFGPRFIQNVDSTAH